jgi:hypothetical protein
MRIAATLTALLLTTTATTGCGDAEPAPENASQGSMAAASEDAAAPVQELPTVLVYKSPTCGCCNGWIEHLEAAGFTVEARDSRDLMTVKRDAGVPAELSSCHTALVDGYVVEGHVPAEHLKRLLADEPEVAGIAVPGMPVGSPGMEGPNPEPYEVYSFTHDGQTAVYAEVDPRQ